MQISREKQLAQKYNSLRATLLSVVLFSAVNLFLIYTGSYFLFSSYFSTLISALAVYYAKPVLLVVAGVAIVPYLLCWIFSKKKVGWLIAGLALFAIDTILLVWDTITAQEAYNLIDIAFHIAILVSLGIAIKVGFDLKKEREVVAAKEAEETNSETIELSGEIVQDVRTLNVQRKKSFVGAFAELELYIDGKCKATLKNGASATISVPTSRITVTVASSMQGGEIEATFPEGLTQIDVTIGFANGGVFIKENNE